MPPLVVDLLLVDLGRLRDVRVRRELAVDRGLGHDLDRLTRGAAAPPSAGARRLVAAVVAASSPSVAWPRRRGAAGCAAVVAAPPLDAVVVVIVTARRHHEPCRRQDGDDQLAPRSPSWTTRVDVFLPCQRSSLVALADESTPQDGHRRCPPGRRPPPLCAYPPLMVRAGDRHHCQLRQAERVLSTARVRARTGPQWQHEGRVPRRSAVERGEWSRGRRVAPAHQSAPGDRTDSSEHRVLVVGRDHGSRPSVWCAGHRTGVGAAARHTFGPCDEQHARHGRRTLIAPPPPTVTAGRGQHFFAARTDRRNPCHHLERVSRAVRAVLSDGEM